MDIGSTGGMGPLRHIVNFSELCFCTYLMHNCVHFDVYNCAI